MAGTITIIKNEYRDRVRTMILQCVSDASGDVSGVPIAIPGGTAYAFAYIPGAGVTNLWDVLIPVRLHLPDGTSVVFADMLSGAGVDLSNSTNGAWTNLFNPMPMPSNCIITPTLSGVGDAQTIHLILFFWEEVK